MNDNISRQKLIEELENLDKYFVEALPLNSETVFIAGEVRELIESQPPADQWIPCSERLPIHNTLFPQKVFVTYVEDSVRYTAKAWLNMDGKWANLSNGEYFDEGSVVAWMPLPEPFKGGMTK